MIQTSFTRKLTQYIAVLPLLYILFTLILYPLIITIISSIHSGKLGWTSHYFHEFFDNFKENPNIVALLHSIYLAFLTVLICGVVGTSLAFFINYFDFPGNKIFHVLLLAPLMLPGVITVISFVIIYGENGLITKTLQTLLGLNSSPYTFSGLPAILFVIAYTQYIYFYLNVSNGIKNLDFSLEEAALNLGASKFKVFFTVIIPLLTPSLVSSSILTFMFGMTNFSAPYLIGEGFTVLSTQIFASKIQNQLHLASVQAIILASISISVLLLLKYYESLKDYRVITKGVVSQRKEVKSNAVKFTFIILASILTLTILLPILTVIAISFVQPKTWTWQIYPTEFGLGNYINLLNQSRVYQPIINSISMVLAAVTAHVIFGSLISYVIVKSQLKIKWLVDVVSMLPWALPGSVIAINLIIAFNEPTIFTFNSQLVGTWIILPIAFFIMKLPLIIRAVTSSLHQMDSSIEEASYNLGASWFYTFRKVTIPIVFPAVLSGGLLCFVTAMGDFTASIMLYVYYNRPLSVAMVDSMQQFDFGVACAYGTIQIVLVFIIILYINIKNSKSFITTI